MISNAFKSAAANEQNQKNQFANTIGSGVKDAATLALGGAGFLGGLGTGALATAAKYNLAGKVGGVGGAIMLSTMDEKVSNAQSRTLTAEDSELNSAFNNVASGMKDIRDIKALDTVWNKIQAQRQVARESKIMKNFENSLGGVDNGANDK